jgi:hypothetical protein
VGHAQSSWEGFVALWALLMVRGKLLQITVMPTAVRAAARKTMLWEVTRREGAKRRRQAARRLEEASEG